MTLRLLRPASSGIPTSLYSACDRRDGRRTRLEPPSAFSDSDDYVRFVQVRGRYVAYVFGRNQSCSQCGPGTAEVKSLNARTGRRRGIGPTAREGASIVSVLVSDARGRLAWTSSNVDAGAGTPRPTTSRELRKFDAVGPGQISANPDIDLMSLRLSASTLTWQEGGVQRSRALR